MDEDIVVSSFGTPEMMNKEDGFTPRGDSKGKAIASKPKEKEIPRYLRASTGSCHDFCKYGKKQITVDKPWRSTAKKVFKGDPYDGLNETLMPGSSKPKKVMEVKTKKVTDDSSSEIIKREVVKYQVSGLKKQEALMISSSDDTPVKQMKKTLSSKLKPSQDSGSRSSGNVDALKKKALTKSYSSLATSKSKVNNQQVASSLVLKLKMEGKDEDAKIKKIPVTPRASLSPRLSLRLAGSSSLRKSQSLKPSPDLGLSSELSRVAPKKVPVTPRASLSPRLRLSLRKSQSVKAASSSSSSRPNQKLRNVNRADESSNKHLDGSYPVEEKTLHVVEMETTTNKVIFEYDQNQQRVVEPFPPLPPSLSTRNDGECTVSEPEEYEYPSASNESAEEEIGKKKPKPRARNEVDSSDEAARKLSFRRGRVVDADTVGENARKLKFRKGRDLGEDKAEGEHVRRSFKKREDIVEEEEDEDGAKVVLRHQDVQEKDAQGLFNNVIEETASKLVKARKSKVKALVGAFETVISLQES